jgi:hypothetical protein
MHIADYVAIGILIGCMAMALHKARQHLAALMSSTDKGGGKPRGDTVEWPEASLIHVKGVTDFYRASSPGIIGKGTRHDVQRPRLVRCCCRSNWGRCGMVFRDDGCEWIFFAVVAP